MLQFSTSRSFAPSMPSAIGFARPLVIVLLGVSAPTANPSTSSEAEPPHVASQTDIKISGEDVGVGAPDGVALGEPDGETVLGAPVRTTVVDGSGEAVGWRGLVPDPEHAANNPMTASALNATRRFIAKP
jgi:hypothetical protein